ncbi:MAG: hypothetical protein PF508_06350 [Spirochaeta sp.]|nr:hypothetical protein [Spirochaeta sp.]
MNIRINGVAISFELEHETTAGQVFDGLAEWLQRSGHRLDRVALNNSTLDDVAGAWRDTPVAEVADLDIDAYSVREKQIKDLETILHYTELLQRVMRDGTAEQCAAVLDELPHVAQGIRRNAPDLGGLIEEPFTDHDHTDPEVRARGAHRAGEMATLIEGRQRELLDPEHEMWGTLNALDAILPTFEEIPGEIQGGDRKRAMELVARFSELVARELRILPILIETRPELEHEEVDGMPINESLPSLNELFVELESAFTNDDYVLIGDLLEYEMLPRFTDLHAAVRKHIQTRNESAGSTDRVPD